MSKLFTLANNMYKKYIEKSNEKTCQDINIDSLEIDEFFKDLSDELLKNDDINIPSEFDILNSNLIAIEEFLIGTYTNQITLIKLLEEKGILTTSEFLNKKEVIKTLDDIKKLYIELENKKKNMKEKVY